MRYFITILIILFSSECIAQNEVALNAKGEYDNNEENDSLIYKRVFLTPIIRLKDQRQSFKEVIHLYEASPKAKLNYKIGKYLSPVAVSSTIGGIYFTYVALNGKNGSAIVRGKTYEYKVRSLPKLMLGLGLFTGGLSLLEYSGELIKTSVEIFNSQKDARRKKGLIKGGQLGFTSTNSIGVQLRF